MEKSNKIFIATSIDGYIADRDGKIDWLHSIPVPENTDMGYNKFMEEIDAIIMGRNTFETVCGFEIDWPYQKPVFVLSTTLNKIPEKLESKAFIINGELTDILVNMHKNGYYRLYIDGGASIQGFLKEDLIDEMIITIIPILLGGGTKLFSELPKELKFNCRRSEVFFNKLVQNHFKRIEL